MNTTKLQEHCEYYTYAYNLTKWYFECMNKQTPPAEKMSPSRIEILAEETATNIVNAWRRSELI